MALSPPSWLLVIAAHAAARSTTTAAAAATTSAAETVPSQSHRLPAKKKKKKKALFLHIGKAGGGTAKHRWETTVSPSVMTVDACHPYPCHDRYDAAAASQSSSPYDAILIPVRDPIDRFVSAFNWRSLVFCDNSTTSTATSSDRHNVEHRRESRAWEFLDDPLRYCRKVQPRFVEEIDMLNRYGRDVNKMAESLCDRGPRTAEQAWGDVTLLEHARYSIEDWLRPLTLNWDRQTTVTTTTDDGSGGGTGDGSGTNMTLLAVVLEPGFDFIGQIDAAARYVIDADGTDDDEKTAVRHDRLPGRALNNNGEATANGVDREGGDYHVDRTTEKQTTNLHSSAVAYAASSVAASTNHNNETKRRTPPPPLSDLGACCVARHYRADYDLMTTLARRACRGSTAETCRDAIRSIYDRRARFLSSVDGTNQSCRALAATTTTVPTTSKGTGVHAFSFGRHNANSVPGASSALCNHYALAPPPPPPAPSPRRLGHRTATATATTSGFRR